MVQSIHESLNKNEIKSVKLFFDIANDDDKLISLLSVTVKK